jgi:hypothetical protein
MHPNLIQNLGRQSTRCMHAGKIAWIKQGDPISVASRFVSFVEHQMPLPFLSINLKVDRDRL